MVPYFPPRHPKPYRHFTYEPDLDDLQWLTVKCNDEMLEIVPKGAIDFPGTGIHDNLADNAKKLGIPV